MTDDNQLRLRQWMDRFGDSVRRDNDVVMAVTGDEGSGKSSIALQMSAYMDPDFDPVRQVVFTADQFTRTAVELPKYSALVLDESISGGFSRDAGSGPNKRLAKFLTVSRERNLFCFLLWPNIRWLDPILKEHRCKWNVHVEKRVGKAGCRHVDCRCYAEAWVRQLRDGEFVFDPPKKVFPFRFPPAVGPVWDAYKKAKDEFVNQVGRGTDDEAAMAKASMLDSLRAEFAPIMKRYRVGRFRYPVEAEAVAQSSSDE